MLTNLIARVREQLAYRRDVAELEAMDDRQLADIGVARFDIAVALREGRRNAPATANART